MQSLMWIGYFLWGIVAILVLSAGIGIYILWLENKMLDENEKKHRKR
jgi:hypothetical protein